MCGFFEVTGSQDMRTKVNHWSRFWWSNKRTVPRVLVRCREREGVELAVSEPEQTSFSALPVWLEPGDSCQENREECVSRSLFDPAPFKGWRHQVLVHYRWSELYRSGALVFTESGKCFRETLPHHVLLFFVCRRHN